MIRILISIFMILHGLVHLLYGAQSLRLFELSPGMKWPDRSWLLVARLEQERLRKLVASAMVLAAGLFILAGIFVLVFPHGFPPVFLSACLVSSILYLILWDGTRRKLADQGGIGILINLGLAVLGMALL